MLEPSCCPAVCGCPTRRRGSFRSAGCSSISSTAPASYFDDRRLLLRGWLPARPRGPTVGACVRWPGLAKCAAATAAACPGLPEPPPPKRRMPPPMSRHDGDHTQPDTDVEHLGIGWFGLGVFVVFVRLDRSVVAELLLSCFALPFLSVTAVLFSSSPPEVPIAGRPHPPRSTGSSTRNRYLHLGQSIFLPTRPGSRIGTMASQLGHCCLKLDVVAMLHALRNGDAGRSKNEGRPPKIHHTQGSGPLAKAIWALWMAFPAGYAAVVHNPSRL